MKESFHFLYTISLNISITHYTPSNTASLLLFPALFAQQKSKNWFSFFFINTEYCEFILWATNLNHHCFLFKQALCGISKFLLVLKRYYPWYHSYHHFVNGFTTVARFAVVCKRYPRFASHSAILRNRVGDTPQWGRRRVLNLSVISSAHWRRGGGLNLSIISFKSKPMILNLHF